MRKVIFLGSVIFVFLLLNFFIWRNERILLAGETVYLELAPVDPRSLMQGDYMLLRYKIQNDASMNVINKRGYLVLDLDDRNVAQYARVFRGEVLKPKERLIRYHQQTGRVVIAPDSFMFQEGHAEYYERAKYGIFKYKGSDQYLLTGLADEELRQLGANAN